MAKSILVVNKSSGVLALLSAGRELHASQSIEFASWPDAVKAIPELHLFRQRGHIMVVDQPDPDEVAAAAKLQELINQNAVNGDTDSQ